jgi:hypothetical protein
LIRREFAMQNCKCTINLNKKYGVIMDFQLCRMGIVFFILYAPSSPLSYPPTVTQNYLIKAFTSKIAGRSLEMPCLSDGGTKQITLPLAMFKDLIRSMSVALVLVSSFDRF